MGEFKGAIEFEFDQHSGVFQATDNIISRVRMAAMAGDFDTAVNLYASAKAGLGDKLLSEAETGSEQLRRSLARMFELARDYTRAARLMEMAGDKDAAGRLARCGRDFDHSARLYQDEKRFDQAASSFEMGGDFLNAAQCHMDNHDLVSAARSLEQAGEFYKAGDLFVSLDRPRDAARCYQQVPDQHPYFLKSMLKLADILYKDGNRDAAAQLYRSLVAAMPCTRETISAYYRLARAYQEKGQDKVAHQLMGKVAMVDPGYREEPPRPPETPGDQALQRPGDAVVLREGFEHVHNFPLLKKLPLADAQEFYDLLDQVTLARDESLIEEGVTQDYLFIVVSGRVTVIKSDTEGGAAVVARLGPGQSVGELSVVTGSVTTASVVADSEVTAFRIHRETFFQFLRRDPQRLAAVYEAIIDILAKRLQETNRRLAQGG